MGSRHVLVRAFTLGATGFVVLLVVAGTTGAPATPRASRGLGFEARTLSGSRNNRFVRVLGRAGTAYPRVAPARYADGVAVMAEGPDPRYVSNRVFNDSSQNLFSENGVSQWVWTWGQFLDHDLGLRDETPAEDAPMAFAATDPLESFVNSFGVLGFSRTPAAPGTGANEVRQQINTVSSFIDGSNVYGVDLGRLEWLRDGPVNGDVRDNAPTLLLPDGFLPTAGARGNAPAPTMGLMGRLQGRPDRAVIAGDVRANENIALTATQTLFAREHNRIVAALPATLPWRNRFEIARRVVGAEIQYVTYNEFLPLLGVSLPDYLGYNPRVNPGVSNEFAVVGFRAHSMVHGEFETTFAPGDYTEPQLAGFRSEGVTVVDEADAHELAIPLTVAFGNPDLLRAVGLDHLLAALGAERQYKNDEQIDNALRSVLFEMPRPGTTDPTACQTTEVDPECFSGVVDLGAADIQRGRDHGMPTYNTLRQSYGLAPVTSFAQLTGETADEFSGARSVDWIDDPSILDVMSLQDAAGVPIDPAGPEAGENAVTETRRSTLAARLRAVYGSVDAVDAFVGMVSEPHLPGSDLGALQRAIWATQFAALRDGDRFFYLNDPALVRIETAYGVSFRHTLAELITLNSGATVQPSVFVAG